MYLYKDPVTFALLYLPQRADLVVSREGFPFLFFVLAFTQTSLKVPSHTISGRFSGIASNHGHRGGRLLCHRQVIVIIASHRTVAPGEPGLARKPRCERFPFTR